MNILSKTISLTKNNRLLSFSLSVVVMVIIVQSGTKLLSQCTIMPDLTSPWLAAAIGLAIVYRVVNAYGWALVLRAMNQQQVNGLPATKIWLRSESRRWLPGGVWGYASRATQAKELGVASSVASASMLLELLLTMAAAVIVTVPVAFVYRAELVAVLDEVELSASIGWSVLLFGFAILIAGYSLRHKIYSMLDRLRSRFDAFKNVRFSPRALVTTLLFYVCMGILNGTISLFLVWSMPVEATPATVVIAATSLAWVIGFLAIFAPGGLFVREASFALCLAPWLPYGTGIALAVLARLLQIGAEILVMFWVLVPIRSTAITSVLAMDDN